jgi:hypothetical protein
VKPPRGKGGPAPNRTYSDLDAAEWVRSVGGKVMVKGDFVEETISADRPLPAGPFAVTGVNLVGCRHWVADGDLERFKHCASLTSLDLFTTLVADDGLKHLKGCSNLTHLDLYGTRVTDKGLEHLTGLIKLANVDLNGTLVTATGVEKLRKALPNCTIAFDPPEP